MRLPRRFERKARVNDRPDLAGFDQRPDLLAQHPARSRPSRRPCAAARACKGSATSLAAARTGDFRPAALRGQRRVALQIGRADHVEHDVDAPARRERLRLGEKILRPVIDRELRAELAAKGAFLVGARRRHDPRAERFGELDRDRADPARSAMNEQGLAGGEAPAREHVVMDREDRLRQGRGFDGVEAARKFEAERGLGQRIVGVAARAEKRADRVADAGPRPLPRAPPRGPEISRPGTSDSPGGGG